jgi:hypothetical protein
MQNWQRHLHAGPCGPQLTVNICLSTQMVVPASVAAAHPVHVVHKMASIHLDQILSLQVVPEQQMPHAHAMQYAEGSVFACPILLCAKLTQLLCNVSFACS